MKTIYILLIAFILTSCAKEGNVIPSDIYGKYTSTQSCNPTYNSNPIITISQIDGESIKFDAIRPWVTTSVTVNCDGNKLSIPSQTFHNAGSGGGNVTLTGNGDYSQSFISLDIFVSYSVGPHYSCHVNMAK